MRPDVATPQPRGWGAGLVRGVSRAIWRCTHMIPRCPTRVQRKHDLIDIGQWAIATGRGWVVRAVHAAIRREGLHDA